MFILVVAFLCVVSIAAIAFTDVIEDRPHSTAKAALARLVRRLRRQ